MFLLIYHPIIQISFHGNRKGGVRIVAKMIIGVFPTHREADLAINDLKDAGFSVEDLSVITKKTDLEGIEYRSSGTGSEVVERTVSGAATGGVLGGLAGLLIGLGVLVIPGIGALLIGGPIAAALGLTGAAATAASGVVTGAVAGGLVGALTTLGIPEEDARTYEEGIRGGGILLMVPVREDNEDEARRILEDHNADNIRTVPTR